MVGFFSVSSVGQTEEAKEPKTGGTLEDALSKAEIQIKAERWEEASGILEKTITSSGHGGAYETWVKIYYWRGICAWRLGDPKQAGKAFEIILKDFGGDETKYSPAHKRYLRATWLKWAEMEFEQGEFEGSANLYRKYIEKYDRK